MPRLHLITAHRTISRKDEPTVIYCGSDADKANAARDAALASGGFCLVDKWIPDAKHTRYASEESQMKFKAEASEKAKVAAEASEKAKAVKAEAEAAEKRRRKP